MVLRIFLWMILSSPVILLAQEPEPVNPQQEEARQQPQTPAPMNTPSPASAATENELPPPAMGYVGIQFFMDIISGYGIIREIIPGFPAEKAGLRVGDVICSVDDQIIFGMSTSDVVPLIIGDAGTYVKLGVLRGGIITYFTLKRQEMSAQMIRSFSD